MDLLLKILQLNSMRLILIGNKSYKGQLDKINNPYLKEYSNIKELKKNT